MQMWNIETATKFIQELHPKAFQLGWNLHLGGGVLTNGFSNNDLDLVFIPRFQSYEHEYKKMLNYLCELGWVSEIAKARPNRVIIKHKKEGKTLDCIFIVLDDSNFV